MKSRSIVASMAAVALAFGLMPLPAFAAEDALSAGEMSAPEVDIALQTQASGTKTVYVLSKVTDTQSGLSPITYKYSYSKKGLLTKMKRGNFTDQYFYKNTKLTKQSATLKTDSYKDKSVAKLTLNKKGLRTKAAWSYDDVFSRVYESDVYKYKSGRVASFNHKVTGSESGTTYTYKDSCKLSYNKSGLVAKSVSTSAISSGKTTKKYSYDKKGNLTKISTKGDSYPTTMENTYKNDRLAQRVTSGSTYTYTYKPVKVPAKYVATVKAQQWSLLNGNLNLAFSRNTYNNYLHTFGTVN